MTNPWGAGILAAHGVCHTNRTECNSCYVEGYKTLTPSPSLKKGEGNKEKAKNVSCSPSLALGERETEEFFLFPLPSWERVRVRVC
jgi:hypothetical protein